MRAVTFQAPGEVRVEEKADPEIGSPDELLEGKDVSFQHGEAADFEKELALESRIAETASPDGEANRFQVAGVRG